jgi:hypothetical protein
MPGVQLTVKRGLFKGLKKRVAQGNLADYPPL